MRKILFLLITCISIATVTYAQKVLTVHKSDRTTEMYNTSAIDSIRFSTDETITYLYMADGRIDYATSTIDSLSIAVSASVPFITLNNGLKMPQLGLGTYDQGSNETACQSALTALRAGYRKFDCAHLYFTEEGIGQGIKESGVPRDSIWITSKLTTTDYDNNNTMASIDAMLRRLQIDYLDLLYIHHPQGRVEEAWPVLEEAVRQGKVRALGVSNFDRDTALLRRIMTIAQIKPVTIQVECHPYRQLPEFRKLCAEYNLQVETWFPLGGTMSNRAILREPVITAIAAVHNKSAAQVILRWHMQMGFCTFPGARNPAYIQENIKIFDFKLSNEEMTQIESINRNRGIFNPAYYE